jgi:hypothetical protein
VTLQSLYSVVVKSSYQVYLCFTGTYKVAEVGDGVDILRSGTDFKYYYFELTDSYN